jgi:streptomycin 6-kinase
MFLILHFFLPVAYDKTIKKFLRERRRNNVFIIPEDFANFMLKLSGDTGQAWLERLPTILATSEEHWNMAIGSPISNLSFNYVAYATLADGTEVIVKTGLTNEFPAQPEALQHFAGHGMVQMLGYDPLNAVMLLERLKPGISLRSIKDDKAAIAAAIEVMRKLRRPLAPEHYPFPTVSDWGKGFARLRKQFGGGIGPCPPAIFDIGERLYTELCESMTEHVLLHGDLHQDNILSAEREPWLAVDPKGVIGEPAYETGPLLRNFWPDILSVPNPKSVMKRRVDQLAAELDFERERVYSWGLARAALSILWGIEDTGKLEKEGLYFFELLLAIKK